MALSSIDRMNGGVCLEKFIYYRRKAFMVKFVHENDDREYIKVVKRKNLERFKQLVSVCIPLGIINYSNCSFLNYEQGV
jgi:RecA/RadA recombinase